jgi:hypothetical protein
MQHYNRFDFTLNKNKKIKIFGVILLTIFIIVLSIFIGIFYNSNTNNHLQTKRRINEIEFTVKSSLNDIKSELYNYTETMSDFMVDVNYNFDNIQKPTLNIEDVYKELKNKQVELQKSINELNELNEKNKRIMIKANAINFLKETYFIDKKDYYSPYVYNCLKNDINIDISNLFETLLEIDYDNLTVSFNYFTKDANDNLKDNEKYNAYNNTHNINSYLNYYNYNWYNKPLYYTEWYTTYLQNIAYTIHFNNYLTTIYYYIVNYYNYNYDNVKQNPIYKLISKKLEINYNSYTLNTSYTNYNYYIEDGTYFYKNGYLHNYMFINGYYLDNKNIYYYNNLYKTNTTFTYSNLHPYKFICNINSYADSQYTINNGLYSTYLYRYNYDEYKYINKLINFESIPIIKPVKIFSNKNDYWYK